MNKNVMFTDIVGYSKLTGADQNLALELLKEHDKIIEPIIKQYKGKIVKRIGDAIVAIFNHSKEVIQASVEIQQALKNRNNRNTKNRHIIIRIGLHYGEIIIKKDEIYGLGYELASSIEPICEFGGIAISEDLYQQSHEKNELIIHGDGSHFFIRPIANFSFKSITNKLKIYKLYLNFLDWYDESQSQVHSYLKEQNIKSNQYDFKNISSNYNTNIQHYDKAFSFYKNNNFSYALYHYKMYLDSNIENQKDTSLYILYIYACLGLDRLVDRICKTLSDNFISELNLIKGIKNFNQSNFTESQIYLEKYINTKKINFLNDATSYLLIIYFQNKDYQKGLDLISFIENCFKSNNDNTIHFSGIKNIFQFFKFESDELKQKIISEYSIFINLQSNGKLNLFLFWFLIQFYQKINDSKTSIELQNHAILLIESISNQISGLHLKNLFIEKPLLHQMLNEELEFNFISENNNEDFIDDTIKIKNEIFKFCINCGFNNKKSFSFCPSCGQKLTK